MADSEEDPQQGGRFSHDSARWQVEAQAGRTRSIYARLGVAVSINSLITALFAVALAAWVQEPGAAVQALAVIVLVIFAIGIIGAFAALRERPQGAQRQAEPNPRCGAAVRRSLRHATSPSTR